LGLNLVTESYCVAARHRGELLEVNASSVENELDTAGGPRRACSKMAKPKTLKSREGCLSPSTGGGGAR
jgi:hypothetical protein